MRFYQHLRKIYAFSLGITSKNGNFGIVILYKLWQIQQVILHKLSVL